MMLGSNVSKNKIRAQNFTKESFCVASLENIIDGIFKINKEIASFGKFIRAPIPIKTLNTNLKYKPYIFDIKLNKSYFKRDVLTDGQLDYEDSIITKENLDILNEDQYKKCSVFLEHLDSSPSLIIHFSSWLLKQKVNNYFSFFGSYLSLTSPAFEQIFNILNHEYFWWPTDDEGKFKFGPRAPKVYIHFKEDVPQNLLDKNKFYEEQILKTLTEV